MASRLAACLGSDRARRAVYPAARSRSKHILLGTRAAVSVVRGAWMGHRKATVAHPACGKNSAPSAPRRTSQESGDEQLIQAALEEIQLLLTKLFLWFALRA